MSTQPRSRQIHTRLVGHLLIVLPLLLISLNTQAQVYIPVTSKPAPQPQGPALKPNAWRAKILSVFEKVSTLTADISPTAPAAALPVCSPEPSLAQISSNIEFNQALLTTSVAARLGIPFLTASGGGNQRVLVRDFTRSRECLATDGITRVLYGQAIRTIITISDYTGEANLSLAAVAANATIKGQNSQVRIVSLGFANPKITDLLATLAGKELNVETYGDFARTESELIKIAGMTGTTHTVERLGIIPQVLESEFQANVVSGYALTKIRDGKSCQEARNDFKSNSEPVANLIDDTYSVITGSCTTAKPDQAQKDRAKSALLGLTVKY